MPRDEDPNGLAERRPLLNGNGDSHDHDHEHEEPDDLWRFEDSPNPVAKYFVQTIHMTWRVLRTNYVNLFLVFVPIGIIAGVLELSAPITFITNFLAIVPLASLLAFATEEIAAEVGQTLGGLMNATFGNAVELIVSIIALSKNEVRIVQSSMLGSILSNILLVLGCCFIAGGKEKKEQEFNSTVASTMSSLMAVASASLVIPATLYAALQGSNADSDQNIALLSHGTSVILLFLYVLYIFFQLKTHADFFKEEVSEEEQHILGPISAGIMLGVITVLTAICAEYLVGSIEGITATGAVSKTFIGLVLIPIVGNAAEHVTAVVVAYKSKMDLAVNVAIGSSMQIALFVTPFMVLLGWAMGINMTLHFQLFETVVFFLSVLVVNYLIQDGKSNYLEGAMCLGMYTIIALAFYVYPDDASSDPTNIGGH